MPVVELACPYGPPAADFDAWSELALAVIERALRDLEPRSDYRCAHARPPCESCPDEDYIATAKGFLFDTASSLVYWATLGRIDVRRVREMARRKLKESDPCRSLRPS